jgi:hypothetical protein
MQTVPFENSRWFQLVVAIASAPVAVYLFDWAGYAWDRSVLGWIIFMSSDAGLTSFVGATLSIALVLLRHNRRPR